MCHVLVGTYVPRQKYVVKVQLFIEQINFKSNPKPTWNKISSWTNQILLTTASARLRDEIEKTIGRLVMFLSFSVWRHLIRKQIYLIVTYK